MKNKIHAHGKIQYTDHVYTATVHDINDLVKYLKNETRPFAVCAIFKIFNAKNDSFKNRLEEAIFYNDYNSHVSIFELMAMKDSVA